MKHEAVWPGAGPDAGDGDSNGPVTLTPPATADEKPRLPTTDQLLISMKEGGADWHEVNFDLKSGSTKEHEDGDPAGTDTDGDGGSTRGPVVSRRIFLGMSASAWGIFIVLSIMIMLIGLDATIVSVATPQITSALGGLDDVGWFGSTYFLAAAASQLAFGALNQVIPHKYVFICGLFLFEFGCLLSGVATSIEMCLIGRALSGLGCSGVVSTSMVLATQIIPPNRLSMTVSFMGAMELVGQLIGPIVGGSFTANVSWRWCFLINVPIGAICGLVIVFLIQADRRPWLEILRQVKALDLIGVLIMTPAVIFILFVVQTGGTSYAWSSATIVTLLVLGIVILIVFVMWEKRKGENAVIPLSLVKNRTIFFGACFAFSNGAAVAIYDYYIPLWNQTIRGYSAAESGILLLPLNACTAVGIILGGMLADKIGYVNPVMLIGGILTAVASGVFSSIGLSTSNSRIMGYSALAGLGGLAMQQPLVAAHNAVDRGKLSPSAISVMLFSNMVGSSASLAVAQAVFMSQLRHRLSAVPDVQASLIIDSGATELRQLVKPEDLDKVLHLYNLSLTRVFLITVSASMVMVIAGLFIKWRKTKPASSSS